MENFKIKSYGKSELAMLYFPQCATTEGAMSNLNFWIKHNERLREELRKCGMPRMAKSYSPREVELIVEYLGEP